MSRVAAVALLLCACGAGNPVPCTTCLQVAGLFSETARDNLIDCGDGTQIKFTGGAGQTRVSQQGSQLQVDPLGVAGVLHADGSAVLGPIPAQAQSVTGGPPTPGKLRLLGWFFDDGGGMQFEGSYTFVADTDGCELAAHTAMRR